MSAINTGPKGWPKQRRNHRGQAVHNETFTDGVPETMLGRTPRRCEETNHYWLVVSTPLKRKKPIYKLGSFYPKWWWHSQVYITLVGGIPTPLKNMNSSVGMIIPYIVEKIKFMFQTTNQIKWTWQNTSHFGICLETWNISHPENVWNTVQSFWEVLGSSRL